MCRKNFSLSELESSLSKITRTKDKIEFISNELLECNKYLRHQREVVKSVRIVQFILSANNVQDEIEINERIKKDEILKFKMLGEVECRIQESICADTEYFIEYAELTKKYLIETLDLEIKTAGIIVPAKEEEHTEPMIPKIIWKPGEDMLFLLFEALTANEMTPHFEREEILDHFTDIKQTRLIEFTRTTKKLIWLDSDSRFSILVNELEKEGYINDENKFIDFGNHFVNKRGNRFKNLAQMRNYTETTNNSGDLIREILKGIKKK